MCVQSSEPPQPLPSIPTRLVLEVDGVASTPHSRAFNAELVLLVRPASLTQAARCLFGQFEGLTCTCTSRPEVTWVPPR